MKMEINIRETDDDQAESSAQIVASIDDLLTKILLRLPVKSLIRFKLVSRHWDFLITNPGFCRLRNPNPNPAIGVFLPCFNFRDDPWFEYVPFSVNKSTYPPFRELKFTKGPWPWGIKILQSCNGLLLCRGIPFNGRDFYVYNPTTKKFSTLPKLDEGNGVLLSLPEISLAFDPAKSPHYKVVCVRGWQVDNVAFENQFEVYSSERGQWIKCGEPFISKFYFEDGVYWNGAIHWISKVSSEGSLYYNLDYQMLEKMPKTPFPDSRVRRGGLYFGESCDHLHYFELVGPQIQFNIYEMKRDYSEWFVKYQVDLSPVVAANPGMIRDRYEPENWYYYAFSLLSLVRGEEEEDSFLVLQIPGKAIRYNLVYKTFEAVHEFESVEVERDLIAYGYQYIESLCYV